MAMSTRKISLGVVGISCLLFGSLLLLAIVLTRRSIANLNAFQFDSAASEASSALRIVRPLSFVTFRLMPDIELWRESLASVSESTDVITQLTSVSSSLLRSATDKEPTSSLKQLSSQLETAADRLTNIERDCHRSLLVRWLIKCTSLTQAHALATEVTTLNRWLVEGDPTLIVLFQNTEELRATGGFMGSYAKVTFQNGTIADILIEDIYEPDGQFTGFVEAPIGAKEYLTSGRGLRLPDANWHPDFPTSAQTILTYFAFGKERSIDGLVAINSDLVERLLIVTGDVFLPDYGMTVTSQNFTTLARADRDQFFPGSQQKTTFLSHFFTVFKVKLTELTPAQQRALLQVVREATQDKTIQFYSSQEEVQRVFTNHQLAGELAPLESPTQPLFYLVESNVGINKANRAVKRQVLIETTNQETTVRLIFNNHDVSLGYANYQRLILSPQFRLTRLTLNDQPLTSWDEEMIRTSRGLEFRQIGFLTTVPSQSTTTVELTLEPPFSVFDEMPFTILKQPGLPPTPYTLTVEGKVETFILEKDMQIRL